MELEDACARTSEKWLASLAFNPNAVSASVTISDTSAKFSPEAAARSIIGARPSSILSVFQPAIAIYSSACPASVAVNCVVEPILSASAFSFSISAADAPEMASTRDICEVKSMPALKMLLPIPLSGSVTMEESVDPARIISAPMPSSCVSMVRIVPVMPDASKSKLANSSPTFNAMFSPP